MILGYFNWPENSEKSNVDITFHSNYLFALLGLAFLMMGVFLLKLLKTSSMDQETEEVSTMTSV